MNNIEKAKRLTHLFYILRKEHIRTNHDVGMIKQRDIMALGAFTTYINKRDEGLVKMNEVSEYFHITPAAVSQMVKCYEKQGWVERVLLDHDRRSVYLKVTEEGSRILASNEKKAMEGITDFMAYLGEEDSDALLRIMEKASGFDLFHKEKNEERKI